MTLSEQYEEDGSTTFYSSSYISKSDAKQKVHHENYMFPTE